jgi:hypothetical protein
MRFEYPSLRQGLVGAWCPSLGASGLSLIDRSGRNNHGTINAGCSYFAGGSGLALKFDGTSGVATYGRSSVSGLPAVSVSFWVYLTPGQLVAIVQGNSETNRMFFDARSAEDNNFYVGGLYSGVSYYFTGSSTAQFNSWTHFCGIIRTGQSTAAASRLAFTNGTQNSGTQIGNASVAFPSFSNPLFSGSRFEGSSQNKATGAMDDIRVYNRALTPAEIRLLASRRGIGLQPLPDRAAGLPRKLFVNDAGTWRNGDAYVNTGSGWRLGIPFVNDAGTWK